MKTAEPCLALIVTFLLVISSTQTNAWIRLTDMPMLPMIEYVRGCQIGTKVYYRPLGTSLTTPPIAGHIVAYLFQFDPNFYIDNDCPVQGVAIQGRLATNPFFEDDPTDLVNIGCTISTTYVGAVFGNTNFNETNFYSYVNCPIDDYIPLMVISIATVGFLSIRKNKLGLKY